LDTGAYSPGVERLEREAEKTRPASESTECLKLYIQYPYAFMARTGTTVLMPIDMFCAYSQLHKFLPAASSNSFMIAMLLIKGMT